MANHKTGAQRYNDRMNKIWEQARKNGALSDKQLFISIRVIEATGLGEANGRACNGEFIDNHDLSDVIVPLDSHLANLLTNHYNYSYMTEDEKKAFRNSRIGKCGH